MGTWGEPEEYEIDDLDEAEDDYADHEERSDSDRFGCLYPDECVMPGEHLECECHTAEMYADDIDQGADR